MIKIVWLTVVGMLLSVAGPTVACACTPYGLIGAKWTALGGASGPEGPCVNDEGDDGAGGRIQAFKFGWIDWDGHSSEAFAVFGLIGEKYKRLGLAAGYNHPLTDERSTSSASDSTGGRYNLFGNGGSIWWRKGASEAFEVHGAIYQAWIDLGGATGTFRGHLTFGFPTRDEGDTVNCKGDNSVVRGERMSTFEQGYMCWRPDGSVMAVYHTGVCPIQTGSYAHSPKCP
jgi:hypothetical protein